MTKRSKKEKFKSPMKMWQELDDNGRIVIIIEVICTLLCSCSCITLDQVIKAELPAAEFGWRMTVSAIIGIVIGHVYTDSVRAWLIKKFLGFVFWESIWTTGVAVYMIVFGFDARVFMWTSVIYGAIISRLVGRCTKAFKCELWKGRALEDLSNHSGQFGRYAALVGGLLAGPVSELGVNGALVLWAITSFLDDLGWVILYKKNEDRLKDL